MKNEEIAKIITELLLQDDVRVEVVVNTDGEAEKVTIGKDISLEEKCAKMLKKFNIPCKLIGYKYLITALEMVYKDWTLSESLTKGVYPEIAKVHKSTVGKVEHGIRHAIQRAYEKDFKPFEENFAHGTKKPTNAEFIAQLVDIIRYT